MRFTHTLILLVLLASGCHRRDAKLDQQIVGTWTNEEHWSVSFSSDGSFSSGSPGLSFQGTWLSRDGELVMTVTNAAGTKKHEPVGSIDRLRIVRVDAGQLALSSQLAYIEDGQTNYHPVTNYFDRR